MGHDRRGLDGIGIAWDKMRGVGWGGVMQASMRLWH